MTRRTLSFLIRRLDTGGAERQLVLLARELHREGCPVTVTTCYPGGAFEQELLDAGVPLHCLHKAGRWDTVRFLTRMLRHLWRERPAVAYGYLSTSNLFLLLLWPALKWRGVAIVCGVRASPCDLSLYDALTRSIERGQRRALRFADAVLCNSVAGRRAVVGYGADPDRCFVVENGTDTQRFRFLAGGRAQWRDTLAVAPTEVLVGIVARHDPIKGYERFIAAAAVLAARYPHARFVAAGRETPGYSGTLRTLVQERGLAGRWTWAGHTDDPAGIYSALDVFCQASLSEGFPNATAEAMSCGLPCVVTDVGDSARLIGDAGWVVPPHSAAALAAGLASAIDALPRWDKAAPRRRIEQQFSVGQMTRHTLSVLAPWLERAR